MGAVVFYIVERNLIGPFQAMAQHHDIAGRIRVEPIKLGISDRPV